MNIRADMDLTRDDVFTRTNCGVDFTDDLIGDDDGLCVGCVVGHYRRTEPPDPIELVTP